MIALRPYQERSIAAVRAHYAAGRKRVLLVAPTGFGKTATASVLIHNARAKGRRVLFLVHRREILADTKRRLDALGLWTGMVLAGQPHDPLAEVQLASVQTVTARDILPPADLVVWDEAHHCAAETYRTIAAQYPDAWHLGLTATPMRADGGGLADAFDVLEVGATVRELVDGGDLAPCAALGPVAGGKGLALDPVDAVREHAAGRRVVAFQRSVEFSRECCARGGARWAHVDGETPAVERALILDRFARGDLDVVSNVFVLTEGWDCPVADVVLLGRSFSSAATYLQAVGRVLRVPADRPDKRALILDLGDNVREHGLPETEREYALDGKPIRRKEAAPPLCRVCGAARRPKSELCWRCAQPFPAPAPPRVRRDKLTAVTAAEAGGWTQRKRDRWEQLQAVARERGYKPGWAAHRFKSAFGHWPPRREAA
jgi:DNA repair protein RadD